jgi:hypothetical protein
MSSQRYIVTNNQIVKIPDTILGIYEFDTIDGFRHKFIEHVGFLNLLTQITKNQGMTCQQFQTANDVEKRIIYRDWSGPSQKKRKTYSNCKEAIWANLGNNNK